MSMRPRTFSTTVPARRRAMGRRELFSVSALFSLASSPFVEAQSTEYPEPLVISKVQLVFSVVSHHCHIPNRVDFYNTKGDPKGNQHYAVPFLVYDPIVTLYNPTNAIVTRPRARVAIYDPPVGFRFKKNGTYLRSDFANGQFHGMARFQIANERNPDARKSFTLLLREMGTSAPGGSISLQPGQTKEFAPWIEADWTWAKETESGGGYNPRSFHDWNVHNDFTNRDGRTGNTFGVETVSHNSPSSGWDPRAGFQMEHLSYGDSGRPQATRYPFEIAYNWSGGWVGIKRTDTFSVEAQAQRMIAGRPSQPDYRVDLLGGNVVDKTADLRRSFPLDLDHLKIPNPADPVISRTFKVEDILQERNDLTPGGKIPFAVLTMVAKSRALVENRFYENPPLPTEELYEFDFREISDFHVTPALVKASDAPQEGPAVLKAAREGDNFVLDVATGPNPGPWKIKGTSSLEAGFTEDVTSRYVLIPGPKGSGIGKAIIDVAGLGEHYFVRIEEETAP